MKSKSKTNYSLLGLLAAASFTASGTASAGLLLAGYHGFSAGAGADPANSVASGITANVTMNLNPPTYPSFSSGGSSDGTYGPGNDARGTVTPSVPANNGFLQTAGGFSSTPLALAFGNSTLNPNYRLAALMFDMASSTVGDSVNISYVTGITTTSLGTITSSATGYTNRIIDLFPLNLFINSGANGDFIIQSNTGTVFLDNVAITAIPEPGSIVALGCVLGSGLLLRTRRRSSGSAEAVAA